ncbi:MAG: hypothetical protein ICV87_08540 [Gemmatimonadetes bacterium]|nr:hypothetical protein [Gemmatimonadota bacterium]
MNGPHPSAPSPARGRAWGRGRTATALLLLLGACTETPNAQYRRGEVRPAAEAYARAVERGATTAPARYNLRTALLRLRQFDQARPHLEAAAGATPDSVLRLRAHYNLGNTELEPAFADTSKSEERTARLRRAVAHYKRALLVAPADGDAKWNLELAQRLLAEPPARGGGGGGGASNSGGGGNQDQPDPQPAPGPPQPAPTSAGPGHPDLSPGAAERILSNAERDERELQRRKLREGPPGERAARDW